VDVLSEIGELQYRMGKFEEGARTMKRAVAVDPQNPERYVSLARMLKSMSRWEASDAAVERALAIDPTYAPAQREKVWLIVQGDRDPAGALGLAAEFGLDPDQGLAWFAHLARDYEQAARRWANVPVSEDEEVGPSFDINRLGWLEWAEMKRGGDVQAVRDSLAAVLERNPRGAEEYKMRYALGLLLTGRQDAGWKLLEEVVDETRASADVAYQVARLWSLARIYARFERREEALALLDEAVARPSDDVWSVADLELEAMFDSIRDDPRFAAILARQQAYEDEQARIAEAEGPWLP
jgi:tetratricopeptide (TPR) repeat protein